ncbi:MAG: glycogen debranching protein [Phototrophicales bacterium]|nr:MAG: glycogen debranching protein [Phototrophicales bacterium]
MIQPLIIGRDVCNDPIASTEREWLITNGIGGYGCGTVSGVLTRRYHGLLVAALNPPAERTTLVTKIDEVVLDDNQIYDLSANQLVGEPTKLGGARYLDSFRLEGTTPIWTYNIGEMLLERRIWMEYGYNTTYISYTLLRANRPVQLRCAVLVNYKDFHENTIANDWQMNIRHVEHGVMVLAHPDAVPFYLQSDRATAIIVNKWLKNFVLSVETYRGQDDIADHLHAVTFEVTLYPNQETTIVASTQQQTEIDAATALYRHQQRESELLEIAQMQDEPDWIQRLVLAADQFIVKRTIDDNTEGRSVIAGYHWFGDWGRDTMISLSGLTLTTKRYSEALMILRTFAAFVDQGMLPNRFPDVGEEPEYNTVDATLWYFEAIRQAYDATKDISLLQDLFPILEDIIAWHQRGTRFNIKVDPADHLISAGEEGVQLTWMDAKVDGWVVTPRVGKPVEINALWYNALKNMGYFAEQLGEDGHFYETLAEKVLTSFAKFWNPSLGYCYDVLDTPEGKHDSSLRPNQLFAVSITHSPLTKEQQRAVVDVCARYLLTPHGMRSLAPFEEHYVPVYGGDRRTRDAAYHQGTVWGWLIGAFVIAHLKVYQEPSIARSFLSSFEHHLRQNCIGSIAEIFDADAPFWPRGCVAQAWSVAEVLRAWAATH